MTKQSLYVVYDKLAEEAGPPFSAKNDAVAVRAAVSLLISSDVLYIDDYELYRIAEIDNKSLQIYLIELELINIKPSYEAALDQLEIKEVK